MYRKEPWTLTNAKKIKKVATKKSKIESIKSCPEVPVAAARIMKLFENNKDKIYTNREISAELGISVNTVSDATNRLEQLGDIRIARLYQPSSSVAQAFQHKDGPIYPFEKIRGKKDPARFVKELFEFDKNKIYTKREISNILKDEVTCIDTALRILVLNGTVKIIDDFETGTLLYQHILGNGKGLKVYVDENEKYVSLSNFLKEKNLKIKEEKEFRKNLPRAYGLFYASQGGLVPIYLKEDLEKSLSRIQKKSILGRIFNK